MKFSAFTKSELKKAADTGLWEAVVFIDDGSWVTVLALAIRGNYFNVPMNATRLSFNGISQKWELSE